MHSDFTMKAMLGGVEQIAVGWGEEGQGVESLTINFLEDWGGRMQNNGKSTSNGRCANH
jgi:hypothetical protein